MPPTFQALHLTGESSGKGRNGYFLATEAEMTPAHTATHERGVRLDVYSKRRGDTAPLTLELNEADARAISQALSEWWTP